MNVALFSEAWQRFSKNNPYSTVLALYPLKSPRFLDPLTLLIVWIIQGETCKSSPVFLWETLRWLCGVFLDRPPTSLPAPVCPSLILGTVVLNFLDFLDTNRSYLQLCIPNLQWSFYDRNQFCVGNKSEAECHMCLRLGVSCPSPSFGRQRYCPAQPGGFVMCCQNLFISVLRPRCCPMSAQKGWWVYYYLSLAFTVCGVPQVQPLKDVLFSVLLITFITIWCQVYWNESDVSRLVWCVYFSLSLLHLCCREAKPIKAAIENIFVWSVVRKTAARNPLCIQSIFFVKTLVTLGPVFPTSIFSQTH